ncbi:mRNA splicing protein prp18 [Loxospora ochrophaea]|nr:mRNA splicing protein prp18 [Loxospora ochrophaea]
MDFSSLMSSHISSLQPPKNPSPASSSSSKQQSQPKYTSRSQLASAHDAAYQASQAAILAARTEKAAQKRKADEDDALKAAERAEKKRKLALESAKRREEEERRKEAARRKRLGLPELPLSSGGEDAVGEGRNADGATDEGKEIDEEDIEEQEVVARLRGLGEPAVLFGEGHRARVKRWRRVVGEKKQGEKENKKKIQMSGGPIPTTLELVPEAEMRVTGKVPSDQDGRTFLFRQLGSYFSMVMREWETALEARDKTVKESFQGRQASSAMVQSRENMKPLFRKFEKGDVEIGILEPVVEIVQAAQERRYVDANDGYLRLSIGKAAWPIGVTMVGIHERSAREKLHESDKGAAHIMSDEVTRKFLQSIKRCLSFAQTRWPPEDQMQLMG